MNELSNLLSSYPLSELLLLIVGLLTATKAIWGLIEFYLGKMDIHFGEKYKNQERWNTFDKKMDDFSNNLENYIDTLNSKIDILKDQNKETHQRQDQTDKALNLVQERLQETSRSYLIDAHHKFCYEYGKIDDLNLQSIERRYLYYKTAGGDTFIDHLMEEIRSLPRVGYYEKSSLEYKNRGEDIIDG